VKEGARVGEVAVVKDEMAVRDVRVLVEVVDAVGVEERGWTLDAVDLITLLQEKFSEVGAILSGNSSNEGFLQAELSNGGLRLLLAYFKAQGKPAFTVSGQRSA